MTNSSSSDPKTKRTRAKQPNIERASPPQRAGKRSYDAASGGRLNPHTSWMAVTSADTEILGNAVGLREVSRDLVRNNPHAQAAVEALSGNFIGTGIRPRSATGDRDLDRKVDALFEDWSQAHICDADGQYGFYGLQLLAVREMIEGGEVLLRRYTTKTDDGSVPLRIQVLEADFLDQSRNGPLMEGAYVNQGVAISNTGIGERVAYWLYPQHPGNFFLRPGQSFISAPVDAKDVCHMYEKQRTQVRGIPWGAASFTTISNLGEYELAEIVRKRTESALAAIVTAADEADFGINLQPDDIGGRVPAGVYSPSTGEMMEHITPGMIGYATQSKSIEFTKPAAVGGYNEYKTSQLRSIAAGYHIPYTLLSGDFSDSNYSSSRLGMIQFRRTVSTVQNNIIIPMMLKPVWKWFIEAAYLAGLIPTDDVPVIFSTPAFEYIDPATDVAADKDAVRSGFKSWGECAYERGRDPEALYDEIVYWQRRFAADGTVLDSNAAAVSGRGVAQKNAPPGDLDIASKKSGKKKKSKKKNKDATPENGLPDAD